MVPYGPDSIASTGNVFAARDKSTLNLADNSTNSYITNDPSILKTALKQQNALADSFLEAYQTQDQNLASVLASNAALAENKSTDGEAGRNRTMLYVTLAVLALVGWIFWKR